MSKDPISKVYVDEHIVRLVALQVLIAAAFLLYSQNIWLALFLTLDFSIRAFAFFPSPFVLVAKAIHKLFPWQSKLIFGLPKRFAATLGFSMSFFIFIALILSASLSAQIVTAIIVICALLESFFKICLGCYLYNWVVAPFVNRFKS